MMVRHFLIAKGGLCAYRFGISVASTYPWDGTFELHPDHANKHKKRSNPIEASYLKGRSVDEVV
jgi:hypothetical protein